MANEKFGDIKGDADISYGFKYEDNNLCIKVDNSTMGFTSNGELCCTVQGGGGGSGDAKESSVQEIISKVNTLSSKIEFCLTNPGKVTNKSRRDVDGTVCLSWKDPVDIPNAHWSKTILVRKQNSIPENETDGTKIDEYTVRDKYAETELSDIIGTETASYFYRAFPVAESGKVNRELGNEFKYASIFGFYIDELDQNEQTRIHYIADNENWTPASIIRTTSPTESITFDYGSWGNAFFLGKPCMLKSDGTVHKYLNPLDLTKYEDGTDSDVSNLEFDGNAMQEFPSIFIKSEVDTANRKSYIYVSDSKVDNTYECWNTKKADGTYADHFYLPLFEGYIDSTGKMRSIATSTLPTVNKTQTAEYTAAKYNGANWYTTTFADEQIMRILFLLLFKRCKSREAVGACTHYNGTSLVLNCGSMLDKGPFWGRILDNIQPYTGIKFFNMENWWSHRYRRSLGFVSVNANSYVKMTPSTIDSSKVADFKTSDTPTDYTNGYINCGAILPNLTANTPLTNVYGNGYALMMTRYTSSAGGEDLYMCDVVYSSTGSSPAVKSALFGGKCVDKSNTKYGLFSSAVGELPSSTYNYSGSSLSYHEQ